MPFFDAWFNLLSFSMLYLVKTGVIYLQNVKRHHIMVEADSKLKLLPSSTLDKNRVFENIDMLSMGIWQ
jgi:hypothetical protein